METIGNHYQRHRSLRHQRFDYTSAGAYFVTICAAHRECLFGEVTNSDVHLSPLGQIAYDTWPALFSKHTDAALDAFVVMPNHVHALIWLQPLGAPASNKEAHTRAFGDPIAGSLSVLVGAYKSSVTQQAKTRRILVTATPWQRNFYDNIVRNDEALARIREYIRTNPARWLEDKLHPAAPPNRFNRC